MTKEPITLCGQCRKDWHYYYIGDRMSFLERHEKRVIKEGIQRILAEVETRRLIELERFNAWQSLRKQVMSGEIDVNEILQDSIELTGEVSSDSVNDTDTLNAERLYKIEHEKQKSLRKK